MQVNFKFGINEIVHYTHCETDTIVKDDFLKVITCMYSGQRNENVYACRYPDGRVTHFAESELVGDPAYKGEDDNG